MLAPPPTPQIEQWLESLFCSSNAAAVDRVVLRRLAKRNRASAPGWGGGGAAEWAAFRWTTLPGVRVVDREAMTQALQTMVWIGNGPRKSNTCLCLQQKVSRQHTDCHCALFTMLRHRHGGHRTETT